jgi:hypothetical protein
MPSIDRRRFIALTAAILPALKSLAQNAPTINLHAATPGPTVPANFIGLSYETQQLSDPTFFSPQNTRLIEQFRALVPNGVLRLGGNTSDVGWWKPTAGSPQPPLPGNVVLQTPPGEKSPLALAYAITPPAVTNLRAFLDATGWTCLYGINLGTNTPARAAAEATFVAKTLSDAQHGGKLEYFQLGNEPDLFSHRFRDKATWTADLYFDDWLAEADAIRAVVPGARFGLPDTAGKPDWYATVVDRLIALKPSERPSVAALTHHYYFGGPPSNPDVNIDTLLHPAPKVLQLGHDISVAAARLSAAEHATIPYRMSEGNTCYRGGKPGVSDVFAAALWSADYFLLLASLGYAGVNLHGGDGKMVADSLGGTLAGELLMPDPKVPHPRPFYTPIAHIDSSYVLEPVGFGIKFAANFAAATMLHFDFDSNGLNATAYVAKLPTGQTQIAIINKDAQPLPINLPGYAHVLTLSAPSLTATTAQLTEPSTNREASTVPPFTAILLRNSRA